MKEKWIQDTYDLVDEIKSQPAYQQLLTVQTQIENDPAIQALIATFKTTSSAYDDVKQYGKYHPDLSTKQQAFAAAKAALYNHPLVAEFKQLERSLQTLLDDVSKAIASSVSAKIKHPNDIGIIPKH